MAASSTTRKAPTRAQVLAECKRAMAKHEAAFRLYLAARKQKNAAETAAARKPHEAEMEKHRPAYSAYWRAYTKALSLGWRKRKAAS